MVGKKVQICVQSTRYQYWTNRRCWHAI